MKIIENTSQNTTRYFTAINQTITIAAVQKQTLRLRYFPLHKKQTWKTTTTKKYAYFEQKRSEIFRKSIFRFDGRKPEIRYVESL